MIIAVSDGTRSFSLVLQWSQGPQEPVGAFGRVSRNRVIAQSSESRAQGLGETETALQWCIRLRDRQTRTVADTERAVPVGAVLEGVTHGRLFNFVSDSLTDRSDALDRFNEAAVTLRALGLLTKAVEPIQTSLEIILAQRD